MVTHVYVNIGAILSGWGKSAGGQICHFEQGKT